VATVYEAAGGTGGLLRLARAWHARVTTTTMARYHRSAGDVPDGLAIPRWSWNGHQPEPE
jgi:hemoglobin